MLCLPKSSSCQGNTKASEGLVPKCPSPREKLSTCGSAEPSKGRLLVGQRGCVRLGRRSSFRFWKLHSVSLGEGTVDLHKCLALGLRDYHVDVDSSEEAEGSEDEKTVGPDGHLKQRGGEGGDPSDNTLGASASHRDFLHGHFYSTPRGKNSGQTGPIPNLQKGPLVLGSHGLHRLWVLPALEDEVWLTQGREVAGVCSSSGTLPFLIFNKEPFPTLRGNPLCKRGMAY